MGRMVAALFSFSVSEVPECGSPGCGTDVLIPASVLKIFDLTPAELARITTEVTTMVCNTNPLQFIPALLEWETDGERTPIQTEPNEAVMDEATPA